MQKFLWILDGRDELGFPMVDIGIGGRDIGLMEVGLSTGCDGFPRGVGCFVASACCDCSHATCALT